MPPDFTVPGLLQSPQKHTGLFQSKGFKETMVYMSQASVISWKYIYTHTLTLTTTGNGLQAEYLSVEYHRQK